jgi:hypothetical protein
VVGVEVIPFEKNPRRSRAAVDHALEAQRGRYQVELVV